MLECIFEEFKQRYREFDTALPTMTLPELDNTFKCLGLSYLNMNEEMWRSSAVVVWKWATEKYMQRESELLEKEEQ